MKVLLPIFCLVALTSCTRQTSESTAAADSTIVHDPFEALEERYDSRDEEEVNPGDSAIANTQNESAIVATAADDSTYKGPADFAPGAAGDPPSPEEEAAQIRFDTAARVETISPTLDELYYTSKREDQYVSYTLRFDNGKISGFCFPFTPVGPARNPTEVNGTIDPAGKFHLNEAAAGTTISTIDGEVDHGNLTGTQTNADKSVSAPFHAQRVGPRPHVLVNTFRHIVVDSALLLSVTLKSNKSKFWQQFEWPDGLPDQQRRILTLDANLDGYLDLFLMCDKDTFCGGRFLLYNPKKKYFELTNAGVVLSAPWVDYANQRIVSIQKDKVGSFSVLSYVFKGLGIDRKY